MKKTAICILIIALLLSACGGPTGNQTEEPAGSAPVSAEPPSKDTPKPKPTPAPEPTAEPKPARTIRIEDAVLERRLDGVLLNLHYPVIICSEGGVSGDLRGVAEEFYDNFARMASGYSGEGGEEWFAELSYEITFLSGDVVSMVFHTSQFTGGMHPMHGVFCRTWTWTGGPAYVQDLFNLYAASQDKSAFWDSIMAEIQRQIREERGDTLPEWAADNVWDGFSLDMLALADGGVNAYYDEYVLGSYADGQQEFFIPLDKIDATPIEWIAPGYGDPEPDPNAIYFNIQDGCLFGYSGPGGKVVVPAGVTEIGYSAFNGLSGMTSLILPDGLTSIGMEAFDGCSGLKHIYLPSTLTEIGPYAFDSAQALTDVYYAGTQEQWAGISVAPDNDPLLSAAIHFAG